MRKAVESAQKPGEINGVSRAELDRAEKGGCNTCSISQCPTKVLDPEDIGHEESKNLYKKSVMETAKLVGALKRLNEGAGSMGEVALAASGITAIMKKQIAIEDENNFEPDVSAQIRQSLTFALYAHGNAQVHEAYFRGKR